MTKEEKKDELKNKISMALKDPILQQGFEIICKENAGLKENNLFLNNLVREKEQRGLEIQEDLLKENAEAKKIIKDLLKNTSFLCSCKYEKARKIEEQAKRFIKE